MTNIVERLRLAAPWPGMRPVPLLTEAADEIERLTAALMSAVADNTRLLTLYQLSKDNTVERYKEMIERLTRERDALRVVLEEIRRTENIGIADRILERK